MKSILLIAIILGAALTTHVKAQGHQHTHETETSPDKVGRVDFPVSCNKQAQMQFNRAVAWLHSFEYEEAEKVFTQVTVTDPRCGMGYWGIAMSNYHPLWAPPLPAELSKGWNAVEKAKAAGAGTSREQGYITAIESFYKDADKVDHRTRSFAYHEAMKRLSQEHPNDSEAAVFYALSLITTGTMMSDKTYTREKEAAEILNRVLARQSQHPGVAHYLIHGYDYPALAQLALPAARSYAKIAPASAHAQHMPSHIFTRLGLWPEAIRSNLDAHAAARAHAVRHHMAGAWDEQLHAMDYLAYAYLQGAQDKKAWGILEELQKLQRVDPPNFKVAYAISAIPARYVLERRRWAEAAKLPAHPVNLPGLSWESFRWAEAHIHFARGIGAVRTGDTATARREIDALIAARDSVAQVRGGYDWAKQVEIARQVVSAWLAHVEGKPGEALQTMRAAADLDDLTEKHPVTPGNVLPAREQLGELLLELKQPKEALQEFESALRSAPNRFNGLYGAARAARQIPDQIKAKEYYRKLVQLSRYADTARPEIAEAKAYLVKTH
jgi:tetratricopeptide (TPR) repeat protein